MSNVTKFQIKGFDHDGVLLSVSGVRDEDECTITRVTAADSQIDITDLFAVSTLCCMADAIDAQLSHEAQAQNRAARAERHQWHREFAIA
ncbi:MAG: hypothetical protein V4641_01815 [Pseudomonadota bacterium]